MVKSKEFGLAFSAVIFTLMGLVQLLRVVLQWDVTLNGYSVPFFLNWMAFAFLWLCAAWMLSLIIRPGNGRVQR